MTDRFLRACRREPVDATPVWFMRQAGRYMAEYRELRRRYSLMEICRQPELAVAVTMQPVDVIEVDAAILFSDLLVPFTPMGLDFDFVKGEGPSIENPIRHDRDVARLRRFEPRQALAHVLETIRILRRELDGRVPLIGFGGAPFTLAAYAIEGGPSTAYAHTKTFMYAQPAAWHRLCEYFADVMADYLRAQVEAGAQAIQIFDSWAGALSRTDYREFALPHSKRLISGLAATGVPVIHFGVGATAILRDIAEAGGDVIGVDWRQPLDEAWTVVGHDRAVQGNLDPTLLLGPRDRLFMAADDVLARAARRPGHIFNLGHGVLPSTPLERVQELARHVHASTASGCPLIAIIGGGITGLAAAYELARRQVPFVLLEASPRLGGLINTEHVDGFIIEAGPDSVLAQKRGALDLFEELGLSTSVIATRQPRAAFVLKRGRLYRLPSPSILGVPTTLTGVLRYRLLPPAARARLSLEPFVRVSRRHDESVGSFFRRRFGAATVDLLAEPLLGGIHAGNVEALSVQSLFPRLVAAEVSRKSVLHAFRGAGSPGDGLFRSLAGGMGTLVETIHRSLPAGSVRLGAPVRAVERSPSGWRVRPDGAHLDATAVLVAAPARAAARMLSGVDDRVAELCGQVPYVSSASIALAWRREQVRHPLAGSGFVVARRHNDLRITACTWVSSKWEGRAPDGMVLLRAFIGGAHDPGAIDLDDPALVDVTVRDLRRVLHVDGPPVLARVHRWRDAGAQHNVGQLARMTELESRLDRHPGLFVAGSGFRSTGIPDCIADGRAAAAAAATYATIGRQ